MSESSSLPVSTISFISVFCAGIESSERRGGNTQSCEAWLCSTPDVVQPTQVVYRTNTCSNAWWSPTATLVRRKHINNNNNNDNETDRVRPPPFSFTSRWKGARAAAGAAREPQLRPTGAHRGEEAAPRRAAGRSGAARHPPRPKSRQTRRRPGRGNTRHKWWSTSSRWCRERRRAGQRRHWCRERVGAYQGRATLDNTKHIRMPAPSAGHRQRARAAGDEKP